MDENKGESETPSISSAMAKTTTISTIAVQSGKTRIVIALLHCGNWLQLKILEITPELTKLGATLAEASELQKAHDEVLLQLKNKQSPVEELLRQADQLIATQKPRAEVYAAMAETLGRAWRDINFNLELRKHILDLNVQYHTKAEEFVEKIKSLEESCSDTVVPIEIRAVKEFLTSIHDLRRTLLESLMAALQAGNSLLGKLKELGAEGTLDSRPDQIRQSVNRALSQVQSWLDELHVRRQDVEATFNRRKLQLEQCLALAILAADLQELEETVTSCRNRLANADQLGDSTSSAELLQHENRKLLPEGQLLQEKALKITKATEQLLASGCFAGEEATKQSYAILSMTSDYLTEVQNRNALLERVVQFFRSAQSAFNKLDQLEIELTTSNFKTTSAQLEQLHAQCSGAIEEITTGPIAEGYALLNVADRGSTGTEGIRKTVEDLENIKIRLNAQCVAHREENMRINSALQNFSETYTSIQTWLTSIAEAFLQGHQDMGSDLIMAQDFMNLHSKLLTDLQDKGNEINALLQTLPPILEYLDDGRRKDVDEKVEKLHQKWMNLKDILENRLDLGRIYVKFHTEADIVNREIDKLENRLKSESNDIDDEALKNIEIKWESLEPLYQSAKNTGLTFISDSKKVFEPHLNTNRACVCVETVLERLAGRQLQVTRNWENFYTDVIEKKELLVKIEETMTESTRTINWVTKLEAQLYPVITINSTSPKEIASFIGNKLETVLPDIKRAQNEVEQKIKTAEMLITKAHTSDEKALNVKNKLCELNHKLIEITTDYQTLLQILISYFNTLDELNSAAERLNSHLKDFSYANNVNSMRSLISEQEASNKAVLEMFKIAQNDCNTVAQRISKQEPPTPAEFDIEKIKQTLELQRVTWENQSQQKREALDKQYTFCKFDEDLSDINRSINNLEHQNQELRSRYGKSLEEAKASSLAYADFEKTIQDLEKKIDDFIRYGEKLMSEQHTQSPVIQNHVSQLQDRWKTFKEHIGQTRKVIDSSIQYFQLVNEADQWFKEGSHLLVSIARRSTLVKRPQEAEELLTEIATFLRPGEEKQNERIRQITQLAEQIYGPELSKQLSQVRNENQEMLKSFSIIREELDILNRNLMTAEREKLRMQKEQEEVASKLAAARAEAEQLRLQKEQQEAAAKIASEKAEAERIRQQKEQQEAQAKLALAKAEALAAEEAKVAAEQERKAAEEAMRRAEFEVLEKQRQAALIAETEKIAAEDAHKLLREEEIIRGRETESKTHVIQVQVESSLTNAEFETLKSPVFITPLADAIIQEGSKFSFICQVTGNPTPFVTWYKAGIPIENNPDYKTTFEHGICTLTIEETFGDDSARYMCRAINKAGSAETTASLSVKETEPEEQLIPPSFSKLLEPACIKEGFSYQFRCQVEGNPLPNVQWYKNQECIDYSPEYLITYNNGEAILKFAKVDLKDKAEYTCKATNQLGTSQSTASLSVTPKTPTQAPSFTVPLSNVMARAGQKIKLECEVTGLPTPNITWFQNGRPLEETRELKLQCEGDRATLVIYEAFPKDAGTYKVEATNIAGKASSSCSVSVKGRLPTETSDSEIASDMEPVKPSIQLPLADLTIHEGSRIRLDCVIIGQPEPEVIWYHDNRPVKESSDFQLLFQGDRCSLVIHEAFSEDGGEYKVVALNSAGEASSKCILTVRPSTAASADSKDERERTISVGYPPKFNKLLSDILVSEGETVVFEGNVSGQPIPEIKWLLNNLPVAVDDRIIVSHSQEGNIKLEINEVHPQDKGVYTVKASNEHGDAKCFAQLIVKSSKIPKTVEYEELKSLPIFTEIFNDKTAFENTSTKFECIVSGKPKPKVKWLFNGEPITGNNNFLVSTSGDRQVLSIPTISKNTEGTFTCVAENEMGIASCSATLTAHSLSTITLPEQPQLIQSADSSFSIKREIHTESSTMMSSKVMSSTINEPEPETKIHSFSSHDERTFRQVNQQSPEISESHKMEEYLQMGNQKPIVHEKSSSTYITAKPQTQLETVQHSSFQKPIIKSRAPKFMTPVIGKIIDQNTTVVLEGILDGQPSPTVSWTKNGKEITSSDRITIKWEFNKTSLEIRDTQTDDAGRYTCTAVNDAGTAVSTADLVVRKSVFPPVFGRRLQAQVIKKNDKIVMEVEVTGTPEPEVTWFKDSIPIEQALPDNFKMKTFGNSHSLVIEKADMKHSGRFMVRAINSGGEAQSIADIAVFEPTPDTMVEVVKTVVFEDVRKHETLTSAADKVSSTVAPKLEPLSSVELPKSYLAKSFNEAEMQNIESSLSSTSKFDYNNFSEQNISHRVKTMRLDYTSPEIQKPKSLDSEVLEKKLDFEIVGEPPQLDLIDKKENTIEEGIETTSITKESSLQYFVKKIEESKENEKEISPSKKINDYKKFESMPVQVELRTPVATEPVAEPISSAPINSELKSQMKEYESSISTHTMVEDFVLNQEPPAVLCYTEPTTDKREIREEDIKESKREIKSFKPPTTSLISSPMAEFVPTAPIETVVVPTPAPITQSCSIMQSATSMMQTLPSSIPRDFPQQQQSYEEKSFSSKHEKLYESSSFSTQCERQTRGISPRPEALEMEKLWIPKREIDHSAAEIHISQKAAPFCSRSSISGMEIITETPRIHYIANVSHYIQPSENNIENLFSKSEHFEEFRQSGKKSEFIIDEQNVRPSQITKAWPPASKQESVLTPSAKPYPSMDSLTIRPVSVQDITNEVVLEPGPPPIIDYAQPPKTRRQSYVETMEHELETKLESGLTKVIPGGVRTIPPSLPLCHTAPPPLPPKKEQLMAPPVPAKMVGSGVPKKIIMIEPNEKFLDLEPFPYKPDSTKPKYQKTGAPPTPSKFIKGKFTDSDYESDFESAKIPPKWKPCASDNEEPTYRRVRAPTFEVTKRSRSTDPEPLPPTKFDHPPKFLAPPRPEVKFEQQWRTFETTKKQTTEHFVKQNQEIKSVSPPPMKPGTPPLYIEAAPKKIDSPRTKRKCAVDGYMADTDEPFFQQKSNKSETYEAESDFSRYEYKSENTVQSSQKLIPTVPAPHKITHPRNYKTSTSSSKKELTATPIITSVSTEKHNEKFEELSKIEKHSYVQQQTKSKSIKHPPPPSPSKFVKGEFRESDYESDYDKPIPKIWKPSGPSDTSNYRAIRPILTPTVKQVQVGRTPTPPTQFEEPPKMEGPLRPKFEPIDKPKPTMTVGHTSKQESKTFVFKPKPIAASQATDISRYIPMRPGSPPEIAYTDGPQTTQIYKSTTSMPYHNAIQHETSNIVHFKESSAKCHRTVSVEQSTKVIQFGDKKSGLKTASEILESQRPKVKAPPPTTPKKFVPGEFRESDYESDIENVRIKPKWTPCGSDTEDLHFKPVRPPSSASRASSLPPSKERVMTPMEFEKYEPYKPANSIESGHKSLESSSYSKIVTSKTKTPVSAKGLSYEPSVKIIETQPGSPPEYGYIADSKMKSRATNIASHHMDNMTQAFKSKTQKFVRDVMNDVEQQSTPKKSILKNGMDRDSQVYREETRAAQCGTKHIDPDTGLIYFKYDFGYEFGIVLPGESKNGGIPVPPKTILDPPQRTGDIEMPVYHETTKASPNLNCNQNPKFHKLQNKTIKWEPTSESELSESEGNLRKTGSRLEPFLCSPVSLSPSLPSSSPVFNNSFAGSEKHRMADAPPSCPATPCYAQKGSSGQIRAPMFITPLRNIAVVSGQNAKFECIVQSEPAPSVLWSKNGRIIEDSNDYQLHYRNGVCRLTISRAYPEDAGTYTCTATNSSGSASTTAILDVPGEIKSAYIK